MLSHVRYTSRQNKGEPMASTKTKPGRGWHGDSARHAQAGKQGGQKRAELAQKT